MKCPKCNTEMRIHSYRYVTTNDNTADEQTKLFIEQDLVCRNKNCPNHGKVVDTIRTELPLS